MMRSAQEFPSRATAFVPRIQQHVKQDMKVSAAVNNAEHIIRSYNISYHWCVFQFYSTYYGYFVGAIKRASI